MKLTEANGWYARIKVRVPILKDIEELEPGFPFDTGCVTLENPDGDYIWIDPYTTSYNNDDKKVGDMYEFESKMEIFNLEENESDEDIKFDFKVEDLEKCTATFYCHPDEFAEDFFDIDKIEITVGMFMNGGYEPTHEINATQE